MDKPTLLYQYQNGNCHVRLFSDGTKDRFTLEDEFRPVFPESIDLKITDYCDASCPMCHENSSVNGIHANLTAPFLSTLHEGTELALGGGNPLAHPGLEPFLMRLKEQGIVANLTINERHLLSHKAFVQSLLERKLIYGLGVSICLYQKETFSFLANCPNAVCHFVLGIADMADLCRVPQGLKALFLGYKRFGRGASYYSDAVEARITEVRERFKELLPHFSHIAFDNLALTQLEVQKHLPKHIYNRFFMGEDGRFTMYVDLVKSEYAVSSTSKERYPLKDDIAAMLASLQ